MSLMLPSILHDDRYDGKWGWENGWPVAKADAPEELKEALQAFKADNQSGNEGSDYVQV